MRRIKLGRSGKFAIVDDKDFERVSQHHWHLELRPNGRFYAKAKIHDHWTRLHRFVLKMKNGTGIVDHQNGNGLDNRRRNLHQVDARENKRNSRKYQGLSKYKGVWSDPTNPLKKWKVCLHVGTFNSELAAAIAYRNARRAVFGHRA